MKSQRAVNSFTSGIDRDTSVNKYQNTTYYDALNMRLITSDPLTGGAMTNVPGNSLVLNFALNDVIIGVCNVRNAFNDTDKDSVIFFATNDSGTDSIYFLEGDVDRVSTAINMDQSYQVVGAGTTAYKAGYLYRGTDLNFSVDHRIKSESRYESSQIRKLYWVDGLNPIRYMNISQVELLLAGGGSISSVNVFEINSDVTLVAPTTTVVAGGAYTSGIVQHAYQLYVKNGTKSAFSPLSNYVNLASKNFSANSINTTGDPLDTNTGNSVEISISNLDENFDRIRIVALHYTQYNLSPIVKIVGEYEYASSSMHIIDSGINDYGTIEISEFRLQGQVDYIAGSLASKNNIMFYANLQEDVWNPSWLDPTNPAYFDSRAIRFKKYTELLGPSTAYVLKAFYDTSPEVNSDYMLTSYVNSNRVVLKIEDFKAWSSMPSDRTVTSVDTIDGDMFYIKYSKGGVIYEKTCTSITTGKIADTPPYFSFYVNDTSGIFVSGYSPGSDYIIEARFYSSGLHRQVFSYTYTSTGSPIIIAHLYDGAGGSEVTVYDTLAEWRDYTYNHDGINIYNDSDNDSDENFKYIYQADGFTIGAEGPNVKVELVTESLQIDNYGSNYSANISSKTGTAFDTSHRSSQRSEVYRIYLVFYNSKMQYTLPQWVCDLRMPTINDSADYNIIETDGATYVNGVFLYPKVTIANLPVDSDLVGWQVFRCERGSTDRSVLATGLFSQTAAVSGAFQPYSSNTEMMIRAEDAVFAESKRVLEMISPEISFNKNLSYKSGDRLRVDGRYSGTLTKSLITWGGKNHSVGSLKITTSSARDVSDNDYLDVSVSAIEDTQTVDSADVAGHIYDGVQYKNWINYTATNTYHGQKGTCLILSLTSDLNLTPATTGYGYGSYVRNVFNTQYNGNTYEARSYNRVIPYSDYTLISVDNATCYHGDTFIGYFAYLRSMFPTAKATDTYVLEEIVLLPCESSINTFYRLDPMMQYASLMGSNPHTNIQEKQVDGIAEWPTTYPSDLGDLYRYNPVYSTALDALTIQCKVFDSLSIEINPFKIIATDKKINNEYSDSWLIIRANNTIELEGKYGDIQNVINFGNKFFAFQNKAVSLISINERSLIQDTSGLSLTLGTGDVLTRYDYLTTSSGIAKHTDLVVSNKAVYYVDRSDKIIYNLTAEGDHPISEVMGIRSLLKGYGNITNVRLGFDPEYKEILFYITDGSLSNTIVYNEYASAFVSRYSFYPEEMYFVNDHFYSIMITSAATVARAYRHNFGNYGQFYGTTEAEIYDSFVDMIINPNGIIIDKYDTIDLRIDLVDSNGDLVPNTAMTTIEASNSYQTLTKTINFNNSDVLGNSLLETAKNLTRKWRVWLLPDDPSSDFYRLTDSYLRLKIIRDNGFVIGGSITCDATLITVDSIAITCDMATSGSVGESYKFTLHDVTTFYRPTRN